ncbi:MAG: hypothetical protein CL565_05680 [Alphaproteobacteria bacterium]|nr:hypothetical protein [Alphaproteobacteria bacterium]
MPSQRNKHILDTYLGLTLSTLSSGGKTIKHQNIEKMLRGIKKYLKYKQFHLSKEHKAAFECMGAKLLEVVTEKKTAKKAQQILIIPSLINGIEIFDLLPSQSFVRWLSENGFDVYILDWHPALKAQSIRCLSDVLHVIENCAKHLSINQRPVHGFGYCMGGTLLAGIAARHQNLFKSLAFLASPWNFHAENDQLSASLKASIPLKPWSETTSVHWIQPFFASLDPLGAYNKFTAFSDMKDGSFEAERFVAVEDWLNSGENLPMSLTEEILESWYLKNKPLSGEWIISDKKISATEIDQPCFFVTPIKDKIVPLETASALKHQIKAARQLTPDCGHIATLVSKKSYIDIWPRYCDWLTNQQ